MQKYGIGVGGVWLDPTMSETSIMCRHPWLANITDTLVSEINPEGTFTNSDLKLAALVLHEVILF